MALSGSTDFNMTALDLIKSAFRAARVLNAGGTLSANDTADGLEALNILLKAWIPHGLKLWQLREQSITLTSGKATYTLGPTGADVTMDRPVDIHSAYLTDTNNVDHHLTKYSRNDYRGLTTKTSQGKPVGFYYDPQRLTGSLSLWSVPGATEAAEYTLKLNYRKPIDDLDATTNDVEIPVEWYHAVKWNLAYELGIEYDTPDITMRRIEKQAIKTLAQAMGGDIEDGTSVMFEVDRYGR